MDHDTAVAATIWGGGVDDRLYGGGGDDSIFGQDGDDRLYGRDGDDVLVGGADKDKLRGNDGRDVLIGGLDKDELKGGKQDDILVGGFTDHDSDLSKLADIRTDWTSADSYTDRVADLLAGTGSTGVQLQPLTTVHDDDVKDKVKGQGGTDWFLVDPTDDDIQDKKSFETLTDIDPFALHAAQVGSAGAAPTLANDDLDAAVEQAIEMWVHAGINPAQLENVTVRIADLPDTYLGAAFNNIVLIDANASGFGWQVNPLTSPAVASDRMDLLTVVSHELGHLLGLDHVDDTSVMAERLSPGVRALPAGDSFYDDHRDDDGLFDHLARDQYMNFGLALSSPSRNSNARRTDNLLELAPSRSAKRHAVAVDLLFQDDADARLLDAAFGNAADVDTGDDDDDLDLIAGDHAQLLLNAQTGDVDGTL